MTIRTGDREAIKVRQFVRVATNLSLTAGTYATDIPPFNPLAPVRRGQGDPGRGGGAGGARRGRLGGQAGPRARSRSRSMRPASRDDDVLALLEEERRVSAEAGRRTTVPIPGAADAVADPPPAGSPRPGPGLCRDRRRALQHHRGAGGAGERHQSSEERTSAARVPSSRNATSFSGRARPSRRPCGPMAPTPTRSPPSRPPFRRGSRSSGMGEGQRLRILIAPGPRLGDPRQIVRVVVLGERGIEGIAATNDRGRLRVRHADRRRGGDQRRRATERGRRG